MASQAPVNDFVLLSPNSRCSLNSLIAPIRFPKIGKFAFCTSSSFVFVIIALPNVAVSF